MMREWIDLCALTEDTDGPLVWQQVVAALKALPCAQDIIVFGSVARGEARTFSDVDILIQSDTPPQGILKLSQRFYGMLDPFYMQDGVLMVRSDDARSWIRAKNGRSLLKAIESEGVPLSSLDIEELNTECAI